MAENTPAIGVIIVAHGNCGAGLLHAAESILGSLNDCASISLDASHDVDTTVQRLNGAAQRLDNGHGVLILTDMFGGTPTNLALSLLGKHKVEVVTGVNLPMLLKVFEAREGLGLADLASAAADAAKAGIVVTGRMLRNRREKTENN